MIVPAEIRACAPRVGPVTMAAIVAYESGGRPYAVGDDTTHRSYAPARYDDAVALARGLLRRGHDIDVGYAQINVRNFAPYGLDVASALRPCTNVAVAARILTAAYRRAELVDGPGDAALAHALSAYNTGSLVAGSSYARGVWRLGARLHASLGRRAVRVVRAAAGGRAVDLVRGDAR